MAIFFFRVRRLWDTGICRLTQGKRHKPLRIQVFGDDGVRGDPRTRYEATPSTPPPRKPGS